MSKLTCLNCAKEKENYGKCVCGAISTIREKHRRKDTIKTKPVNEYDDMFSSALEYNRSHENLDW